MPAVIRSFIAVDVPPFVREEIKNLIDTMRTKTDDFKWVRPENLHFTLKFLGDVPEARIPEIKKTLERISLEAKSFRIHCAQIDAFPNATKPNVIWAGADEGDEELKSLSVKIESGLEALGFKKEDRAFSAHLTLGRLKAGKNSKRVPPPLNRIRYSSSESFLAEGLILYRSLLTPEGPVYEVLEKFDFHG